MQINCSQCGAQVDISEGQTFVKCPFCESALYIDKSRVVFHYYIEAAFPEDEAEKNLRRWMAGNLTVKGLDTEAKIVNVELVYFPVWRINTEIKSGDEDEKVFIAPAASTFYPEIADAKLPAGKLVFYTDDFAEGKNFTEPAIPYNSALAQLGKIGHMPGEIKEVSLVHIPLYRFTYSYRGAEYNAIEDASTGQVLARHFPAKSEAPFMNIAIVAAVVFFIEGMFTSHFIIKLGLYLITAIPFIFAAEKVAREN